ncbi:mucin-5AC [Dermacentor albipictus]|uniref:mucin-5AC n=1 Tax=Dermacentor albipictus TaxID=60249 RepID=UPI0038FBF125
MDPTKTKTLKKEKASVKSEVGCCVKDEPPEVEAADCAIDVSSRLTNGIDYKENVSETENMGMFSGPLETEATKPVRNNWMKTHIEQSISEEARKKVATLIEDVGQLTDIEKLYLYVQLPTGTPVDADPLKQKSSGNPLGKKADAEVAQTYTWIQSHLEEDPETSLPKQEVYEEYRSFFEKNKIEPLCAADFGKVMKHVFPSVRPRRLGTRGNSRYCYSGLRKKCEMRSPTLPDLSASEDSLTKECPQDGSEEEREELSQASWLLVREWAEKVLSHKFPTVRHLARHLVDSTFVDACSVAAVTVLSAKALSNDKGSQASSTPRTPGKRREAQQQLQRKLQEKKRLGDQKRKLTEQRSHSAQSSQCSTPTDGRSSQQRRALAATPQGKRDQASPSLVSSEGDVARRLKEEPAELKLQTSATPGNNIIFVPTVQGLQLGSQDTTGTGTMVATAPGCKYKKIQPKPATCRSTAVVVHFSREGGLTTPTAEVVSSSQSPVVVCADPVTEAAGSSCGSKLSSIASQTVLQVPRDRVNSSSDWDAKPSTEVSAGTMKRHSEDGEALLCKRRHTDDGTGTLKLESASLDLLVPTQGSVKEEMCVGHLEKEALNEYYGNTSYDTSVLERLACKDELSQGTMSNEVTAQAVSEVTKAHCAEHKTAQLSQLRMLLERNLPSSYHRKDVTKLLNTGKQSTGLECGIDPALLLGQLDNLKNGTTLKQVTVPQNSASSSTVHWKTSAWTNLVSKSAGLQQQDDLSAISLDGLVKLKDPVADAGHLVCDPSIQASLDQVLIGASHVSIAPVPCSPNSRGRFFTPISPQTTPHPDSLLPSLSSPVMATSTDMVSVAVGTSSQPPSATSSPFVSPRGTPVPWTRSRHSSGQSGYSGTPRQTPFQAVDSGVSSVSGSPFVSPQSTPVTAGRVRHNATYNPGKAVTFTNGYNTVLPGRARHSSGPGGPPSQLVSPRSAPLSPMVGESATQTSGFSFPAVGETPTLLRSRHNSASSVPPPSPQSAPLSPLVSCPPPAPSLNDCSSLVPSDTDSGMGQPPSSPSWIAGLKESTTNTSLLWPSTSSSARQRHASGPVLPQRLSMTGSDPLAHEIQEYFKNTPLASGAPSANRSRSVPVHQMLLLQEEMEPHSSSGAVDSFSKSYPATPSMGQCFNFPQQSAAAADPLTYTGTETLAQQDDVFLASDWNSTLENEPAMKFEDNDDFDAELQSTLEDLKDCDEFSKFAKELDFTAENEDDEMT